MKLINKITSPHALMVLLFFLNGIGYLSAQELLTNETIISMSAAKVDKALILSKIKSERGNYDLSTNGCIGLRKAKVADVIVSEMMLATKKLPTLVNDDIIAMYQGDVSKDIIIKKIQSSPLKFDLKTDALIKLKTAKVPDQIVKIMMEPNSFKEDEFSNYLSDALAVHPQDLPVPAKSRVPENGIYYEVFTPKIAYSQLEPSTTNQTKSGSFGQVLAQSQTGGIAKVSQKVGLSNTTANMIIKDNRPVFYFAFSGADRKDMNNVAENIFNGASSPNDFVLIKAAVSKRGREITIGKSSAYTRETGFSTDAIQFRYKKISNELYKVYFDNDVPAGEYAFFYNKGSEFRSSLKVYDFSLQNNTKTNK